MARRPTMAEVARAAGVSVMTVSYAYAQPERVSDRSRAKVREAAERLGYPGPHPGARSLRRGRAGSLGVVLGEHLTYAFEDPQAVRFLAGVAGVCAGRGLGMTIVPAEAARVAEAAVDGFVVWTTADDDPVIDAVATTGLPAAVHGGPERPGMGFVAADDRAAAAAVAAEAFAGARSPAVLSFPLDRAREPAILMGPDPAAATFRVTRERLLGFRDAWERAGGSWSDVRVVVCSRNSAREAEERTAALLGRTPDEQLAGRPDAIAAMSDELALGALRAGLGDVRVTGWDDGDAAEAAGLTTIAQSLHDQGARCARLVLGEPPAGEDLGWRLVRRGYRPSTGR